MRRVISVLVLAGGLFGQEPLVAPGAVVKKLADGFRFTEGPAVDARGNVFFSDIPNDRIHRWSTKGKLTTFRENSGGANGLYFDRTGNLLACEGKRRQVVSITPDGKATVLAKAFQEKPLNSPNDLWIDPDGGVWFTDPRYGRQEDLQQGGFHVYRIAPKTGEVSRVLNDLVKPNGIVGTHDGKILYVADAGAGKIWSYRIKPGGRLEKKKLHAPQRSDGMTLDARGNLYVTFKNIAVWSPEGRKLRTIEVPESPANVCFGGPDRKTLFITARTSLYALAMNVRGQ